MDFMILLALLIVGAFMWEMFDKSQEKYAYKEGDRVVTNVVGVSFEGRQQRVSELEIGEKVILKREPHNQHDKNSIAVHAFQQRHQERTKAETLMSKYLESSLSTTASSNSERISWDEYEALKLASNQIQKIGYINRKLAKAIAPIFDKYPFPGILDGPGETAKILSMGKAHGNKGNVGITIEFYLPSKEKLDQFFKLVEDTHYGMF